MKEGSPNHSDFDRERKGERRGKERENQERYIDRIIRRNPSLRFENKGTIRRTRSMLQSKIKERSLNRSDLSRKGKEDRKEERIRNVESFVERDPRFERENEERVPKSFRFRPKRKRREERKNQERWTVVESFVEILIYASRGK